VLRKVCGPKIEKIAGAWISLHNEEFHDGYTLLYTTRVVKWRRMRWAGHAARMCEMRSVYKILVGKSEGKRPLGRPRRRWKDNIGMDLKEISLGWNWFTWLRIATSDELFWTGNELSVSIKGVESLE